jgi:hypothetical protein
MITVKEEFLSSVKTRRAVKLGGFSVLAVWLAMKGYVATSNSGGFVPKDTIDALPGIPSRWQKAMAALIECGKLRPDGSRGPGLVEQVEHGYRLHDYEDHGTPVEVEDERRRRARERKAAYRLSLVSRGQTGDNVPSCPGDNGGTENGTKSHLSLAGSAPGPTRALAHPSPAQPSPAQFNPDDAGSEDLTPTRAHAREENADGGERETICPMDLEQRAVELGVVTQLAVGLCVPEPAVLDAVREFVTHWTIGGGAGQRRAHWMRRLRRRVKERAEQGLLKPIGLLEHEQTGSDPRRIAAARRRGKAARERLEAERGKR